MKVKELRSLLKSLPAEMEVVMLMDDDSIITVCKENSHAISLMDEDDEDEETVLILVPCGCYDEDELELGKINSQPELN